MKRILSKLPIETSKIKKIKEVPAGRITNDTLAEHREKVLAGGRKFKYPIQYARYRLVINTVIIVAAALVLLLSIGWWQLYPAQNTSNLMYRITKVLPLPVAKIDGVYVRYSDYLMRYRSSIQYLLERDQIDLSTEDGQTQVDYVKRREMDETILAAYANNIAKQRDIEVSDEDLEAYIIEQREGVSEETYNSIIDDYYGWSSDEYRYIMRSKLLIQKVSYAVDDSAKSTVESIQSKIDDGQSLKDIAETENNQSDGSAVYTAAIWVPKDNLDYGLAEAANELDKGQISEPLKLTNGDGYYFVKKLDSNDTQVQYEYIRVPLYQLDKDVQKLKDDNKVKEYIKIEDIT